MISNASVEFHLRFVKEKHSKVIQGLNHLLASMVSNNSDVKLEAIKALISQTGDLREALAEADRPPWLVSLNNELTNASRSISRYDALINSLISLAPKVRGHEWTVVQHSDNGFDFDSIFERYRAESRLPELFQEIVKLLEDIKSSGEVDSLQMMNSLSTVIPTIEKNKEGSYFSINSTWDFFITLLENYLWSELSRIPVLGPVLEALEKTIKETNAEIFKLHADVQTQMKEDVFSAVKGLPKRPDFSFMSYDKSGSALPNLEDSSLSIEA